jgi:DeoR family ulaG and ulaABCDEF operon transcriptional repressor
LEEVGVSSTDPLNEPEEPTRMHATQRERLIVELLDHQSFISFREIESRLGASPATIRRDLERLAGQHKLRRVRGGAQCVRAAALAHTPPPQLGGRPQAQDDSPNRAQKALIGKAAAALCVPGEGVMIDRGTTTLEMCPHLAGLNLQVLTNSLSIVSALLAQHGTQVLVPAGAVFREQNIILPAAGENSMPRFHAPKLFRGATAIGPQGVMQSDAVVVAAERQLIERAKEIIVLVDSSKFRGPSGHVVCGMDEIDTVVTDAGASLADRAMLADFGVRVVIAQ